MRRRRNGEQQPDTLESLANLGLLYYRQGKAKEAETLTAQGWLFHGMSRGRSIPTP